MRQLTVRGFDDELSAAIKGLAQREGISLNKAALRLLRKGAGLTDDGAGRPRIGDSLDHFFGSWTQEQADELNAALKEFDTIDEEMWK
ncbi:MAG: hypothetical protein F4Y02_04800 [Chloroflexi bacterium]|nr:hypothetical protein [Chloroflexota bacterium]